MVFSSTEGGRCGGGTLSSSPLLPDPNHGTTTVEGVVDYKGRPATRSNHGGWRSASFIISVEMAERFAYSGIVSNLTDSLHQSTASAAANVNAWIGTCHLLPLLAAFLADSYLGRYRTILFSSLLYILGLGLLTVSAVLDNQSEAASPSFRVVFFFVSLYLVAFAQAGHKPCVQAFGADQFDAKHALESKSRSSFFNWWYLGVCSSGTVSILTLNYIQDNLNWVLGFGIPCAFMAAALVVFLSGSTTYRYPPVKEEGERSAFARVGRVFLAAARNWRTIPSSPIGLGEAAASSPQFHHQFKFLDKALNQYASFDDTMNDVKICTITQVEEAKSLLRLFPIWATCLIYTTLFAQILTFFTKQGGTMDRSVGSSFVVPAASLQAFITLSIVLLIPIYDRVFVPIARTFTKKPSGITMLQRIGCGIVLCGMAMVVAALVETRRLKIARNSGLVDDPTTIIPMSVWWLAPQYILIGISEIFTVIGMQEFFYDQVPNGLKSLGLAIYLSTFGAGFFLSGILIYVIEMVTGRDGRDSWFSDNLNRAHLDYFYWILAGLGATETVIYLYFTNSYVYASTVKRERDAVMS